LAEYSKSAQTRAAILEAAERLYWEKGYTATRNRDVAAAANCPESLLAYHFGKKEQLAEAVYRRQFDRFISASYAVLDEMGVEDYLLRVSTGSRIAWALYGQSPEYRRFFCELAEERIIVKYIKRERLDFYSECNEQLGLGIDLKTRQMLYAVEQAAADELKVMAAEGDFFEDIQDAADWDITLMLTVIFIPKEKVDEIVAASRALFSRIHVSMQKNFRCDISI